MTVRQKTLIGIGVTLLAVIGMLSVCARHIILRSFRHLETEYMESDVRRLRTCAETSLDRLRVENDGRTTREEANSPAFFAGSRLNLVAFADLDGRVLDARCYDTARKAPLPVPTDLAQHLRSGAPLATPPPGQAVAGGLLLLGGRPMLVVSRPLPHGAVVLGRFLDEGTFRRFTESSRLAVRLANHDDPALPDDFRKARALFSDPRRVPVLPLGPDTVAGFARFDDLYGRPAVLAKVEGDRRIYRHGVSAVAYFIAASGAVVLLLAIASFLLLERLILARLFRLNASVRAIGALGEISARVSMDGNDELSSLAGSVNAMLDNLANTQKQLRAQETLKKSEARYRGLVEALPEGVYLFREGKCVFANPAGATLLGEEKPEAVLGKSLADIVHPSHRDVLKEFVRQTMEHRDIPRLEAKLVRADGTDIDVNLSIGETSFENRKAIQLVALDMSRLKEAENRLDYLAYHDQLTGLPNLLLLNEILAREIPRARRRNELIGALHVDVNRFKEINDTLGYQIGDKTIQDLSRRLCALVRESDTVARMSGDKFLLILPGIQNAGHAEETCRRILGMFSDPFHIEGHEFYLNASIGISFFPGDGETAEEIVKHAEIAMYRAKAQGSNTYQFFSSEMVVLVAERKSMENDLRKALERQEFLLFYQPEIDLVHRTIVGAEALLRWKHPTRGLVPPMQFIPLAEETGLIIPISEWVFRTAAAQNKAWQDAGHSPIRVAVNVSARSFEQPDFVETVTRALADAALDPKWFEIEITETMAMKNFETTIRILEQLHDLGVYIAIDDFGTGHSSLSYLKKFPAHMIKVDRSFIKDMHQDGDDAAIARAIIAMSHSLKMRSIAEGVETTEQLGMLLSCECDEVQGFLFSKPIPTEEFAAFLTEQPHHAKFSQLTG